MRRIAAVVLEQEGKILICQRKEGGACSLLWEFPGGKVERGESVEACAHRELREELGVEIELHSRLAVLSYTYPGEAPLELTFFKGQIKGKEVPEKKVHLDIRWISPEELKNYPFCPANEPLLDMIMSQKDQ